MPLTVKRHKRNKVTRSGNNRKKIRRKHLKLPNIPTTIELQKAWKKGVSAKVNLKKMGLSHDPNLSVKETRIRAPKDKKPADSNVQHSAHLEEQAKAPRNVTFKLPAAQERYYSYLMQKYGENYKEMANDSKNVYQETWKQIRGKITQFRKLKLYSQILSSNTNSV